MAAKLSNLQELARKRGYSNIDAYTSAMYNGGKQFSKLKNPDIISREYAVPTYYTTYKLNH